MFIGTSCLLGSHVYWDLMSIDILLLIFVKYH